MIITLLVYYPTLKNGFLTGWDDQWMVFSHYTERGWTVDNLWHIFTDFYGGQYAPLAFLSYLVLYAGFGYDPFYFHMFSLLLHIGCVCLVWKLISSLLRVHGGVSEKQILYVILEDFYNHFISCLLYTSPSPRDLSTSRMPSSA